MRAQRCEDSGHVTRIEDRIEKITDPGADQRQLATRLPLMQEARQNAGDRTIGPEDEHLECSAAEVLPPGEQPLRRLERSRGANSIEETQPFRREFAQACNIIDE